MRAPEIVRIEKASTYELVIHGASALAALLNLAQPATQSKVMREALASGWALNTYNAGIMAAAVLVFTGWLLTERGLRSPHHSPVVGLLIERLGLLIAGPLLVAYACAVWVASDAGVFAGAISFAVGCAHGHRAWRIRHDLRSLRALTAAVCEHRATEL